MNSLKLSGTHGTSKKCALSIQSKGFSSSGGLSIHGIYFWADSPLAELLARAWFQQKKSESKYHGELNPQEAVIFTEISCSELEGLDFEDQHYKSKMMELVDQKKIDIRNRKNVAIVHKMVMEAYERVNNVTCKVVSLRLPPPNTAFATYSIPMYGAPLSYIVRDGNCITIKRVL